MHKISKLVLIVFCILVVIVPCVSAQELSDYLIVNDIGSFRASKNPSTGEGAGILAGVDHFNLDHHDLTYRISYFNLATRTGAEVQVTQHAGADSDSWLLHEVEDSFRSPDIVTLGLLTEGTILRKIGIDRVIWIGLGGGSFVWLSDNVVLEVQYTDLEGTKPEPLEVVQAYLQKFPSTIPITFVLDKDHNEQWIKGEMERRLWLCDKWFQHFDEGQSELYKTLSTVVNDHLDMFLDYREKYYGMSATNEKNALFGYLSTQNDQAIRSRLNVYKIWWDQNKENPINLP